MIRKASLCCSVISISNSLRVTVSGPLLVSALIFLNRLSEGIEEPEHERLGVIRLQGFEHPLLMALPALLEVADQSWIRIHHKLFEILNEVIEVVF